MEVKVQNMLSGCEDHSSLRCKKSKNDSMKALGVTKVLYYAKPTKEAKIQCVESKIILRKVKMEFEKDIPIQNIRQIYIF